MPLEMDRIPFGLANITIGEGEDAIKFDGVNEFQAEGGEITISPILEPIVIADMGNGDYDDVVVGYTGTMTINAAQESLDVLELALTAATAITGTDTGTVTGLMDSPIGTSLRKTGKRVTIHPRRLPPTMKDMDITIFKMISSGEFTRTNGNTQGSIAISMKMLPRDGMDPSKPGNYFYTGANDPSKALTT